jgi:hypothetical protein
MKKNLWELCYSGFDPKANGDLMMAEDLDEPPKEPAIIKAKRRWGNHDLEKRVKEDIKAGRLKPPPIKAEPDIADVVTNDEKLVRGRIIRAQTKFAKDIENMLKRHTLRNIYLYKQSLIYQKKRLLFAKLKLLEKREAERLAQLESGGSNA